MFYSTDVRHERFWRVGIARNAVFFHSFVASKARKGRSEERGGAKDRLPKMSTKFAPRLRARAIWKSKSLKTGMFGELSTKFAPRLRARAIWKSKSLKLEGPVGNWAFVKIATRLRARVIRKSKSLKTDGLGAFSEVQSVFRVAGAGISTRCKMRGRRRSSCGLQKRWQAWGIWRGSETMRFAWQAQWFRALWCRCLKPPMLKLWKGCKFHATEVLLCSDHFVWQLQDFVCLGSTFSWQAQYFWSIHFKIVNT